MPQIKINDLNNLSNFEKPSIKKDAWEKSEPVVLLELPEKTNDFADESVSSVAFGVKAYAFADGISMHGIRYIVARDTSKMKRLMWLLLVLGAFGYCGYIVYETFTSYLKYPTTTSVGTTFEKQSPFPAVTICNFNAFQRSKLSTEELEVVSSAFGSSFGLSDFLQEYHYSENGFALTERKPLINRQQTDVQLTLLNSNQSSLANYVKNITNYLENNNANNESSDYDSNIGIVTDILTNESPSDDINNESLYDYTNAETLNNDSSSTDSSNLKHTIDVVEFFFNKSFPYSYDLCMYRGTTCEPQHFSRVLTDFGVCLKFDPSTDTDFAYQTSTGPDGGLFIAMQYYSDEWTPGPYFSGEGFRIAIHKPGSTLHNVYEQGVSLRPGLQTEIGFTRMEGTYMGSPYGNCGEYRLAYSRNYSRLSCLLECETNHTVDVCNCKYVYMPGPAKVCSFAQYEECRKTLSGIKNDTDVFDASKCNCPSECSATIYETSIIETNPAKAFKQALNTRYNYDLDENAVNFLVFYKEFQIETLKEEPEYTVEKLWSNIGGAAGLFLGCSVLTFMEIIDFLTEICWFLFTRPILSKARKQRIEK